MTAPAIKVLVGMGALNVLSADDASFEGGLGSWAGNYVTIAQSSAEALDGVESMAIDCVSGLGGSATSGQYPVIPSETYSILASFRAATTGRSVGVWVDWYDANGNFRRVDVSSTVTDSTSGWTQAAITVTSPDTAATAQITVNVPTSGNETHYVDCVGLMLASTSTWALRQPMVDVSVFCTQQIDGARGRSREIDEYQAGTLSFTLRNENRDFDPANTASPYAPGILPGADIQFSISPDGATWYQIFGGYVDDLDVQYTKPNICTVTVSCLDGFTLLANTLLNNYNESQQTSGERIAAILARPEVDYTGPTSIATGQSTLQASSSPVTNTAPLSECQTAADSEAGFLFVDRLGVLQFHDRYYVSGQASMALASDVVTDLEDGAIGYQGITQASQALLLYSSAIGTRTGGVQQSYTDAVSQAQYHLRTLSLPTLENEFDSDVYDLCAYMVGRYSQPDIRFDTVTVELQSVTAAQLAILAQLELATLVTVSRTPPGEGSPTTVTVLSIIDMFSWNFNVSSSSYTLTLSLGSVDSRAFFILDDPVFGVLDSADKLNF